MTLARYRRFAWTTLALTLLVIAWGALVRATGSGAGCGNDWPTCQGALFPKASSVATFIEYFHRLSSGVAFLFVLALVAASRRAFARRHPARRAAAAALVLMLTESAVGAGLVLLDLVGDNRSVARAAWMALHLTNTYLLLAALTLAAWWSRADVALRGKRRGHDHTLFWAAFPLAALLVVGVSGAITALGDTLFPATSLAAGLQADFSLASHFLVQLRVLHPLLALGATLVVLLAVARLAASSRASRRLVVAVLGLLVLQLAGGFVNLLLLAPIWLQLVHLVVADSLWIAVVLLAAARLDASAAPRRMGV